MSFLTFLTTASFAYFFLVCPALLPAGQPAVPVEVSPPPAQDETAEIWGKYANSLMIRTRTAGTYPAGLTVFTVIGTYQEFTERRNPATDTMETLPPAVDRRQSTFSFWAEQGLTDSFQVGVAFPFIYRTFENSDAGIDDTASGLGDILLYSKYRLHAESRFIPQISVDGFLKLPTGSESENLGNGEFDAIYGVMFSKRWEHVSLHLNPDYAFTGGDRSKLGVAADNRTRIQGGAYWHLHEKFLPALEWNSMWWGDVGHQHSVGGGFLWFPTKSISLKLAAEIPVDVDLPWRSDVIWQFRLATWF